MSISPEQMAQREWEIMCETDTVRVVVPVRWHGRLCLPCEKENAEEEVEALFKSWTYGDNWVVERACRYKAPRDDGKTTDQTDLSEFRRMMLKRGLLEWNLSIPVERDSEWLTSECYDRIGGVSGPLVEALVAGYERTMSLTEEEEDKITRQALVLFSPNGRGVMDACEAVSMFCTWGNFAEKLGLDKDKLLQLPYREYIMLKIMMGKESDAVRKSSKSTKDHHSNTRIAGAGGRIRPARGTKVAM